MIQINHSPRQAALIMVLLPFFMLYTGCTSVSPTTGIRLDNPGQLRADAGDESSRVYRSADTPRVTVISVAPVGFAVVTGDFTADESVRLTNRLATALRDGLAAHHPVGEPGDLIVRATITAVDRANPAANVVSTALLGAPVNLGGVVVEIEAVEAATGRRVAAARYVEAKSGIRFKGSFSSLGHAEQGLEQAALRFCRLLFPSAPAS